VNPNQNPRFSTGRLDPPTRDYSERDTYTPNQGASWSQAEYAAQTDQDAREPRKPMLTRILIRIRRSIWGS
jgi:hypothetical protein